MDIASQTMSPMPLGEDEERTVVPAHGRARAVSARTPPIKQSSNSLPVGTRLGEFEITRLIGIGGFGIVYLAFDHSLQRNVALKEYMPASLATRTDRGAVTVKSDRQAETFQLGLRSFVNEAHLLAQHDHPALLKVYRFWEANGTAYMVMPYYEGLTLKQTIKNAQSGPPDERWLRNILRPLTDALALIHRGSCFHRDIAPDNILILSDGRPLLLDFGAARRVIGDMTHSLTVILKPGYAPIEQYAETPNMKQGAWTDIYALASVVYFAISGQAPVASVARVISDALVPLAALGAGRYSASFLRGVDKAMAVRPEDRPQSMAEFCELLGLNETHQEMQGATPAEIPAETRAAAAAPRRKWSLARYAAGAIGLAALAWVAVHLSLREPTVHPADSMPTEATKSAPAPGAPPDANAPQSDQTTNITASLPAASTGDAKPTSTETPETDAHRAAETQATVTPSTGPLAAPLPLAPPVTPAPIGPVGTPGASIETKAASPAPDAPTAAHKVASERATAPIVSKTSVSSTRCTDILERASLGEKLTSEEQSALKGGCN